MAEFDAEAMAREHGFQSRDELTTQIAWRLAEAAYRRGREDGLREAAATARETGAVIKEPQR